LKSPNKTEIIDVSRKLPSRQFRPLPAYDGNENARACLISTSLALIWRATCLHHIIPLQIKHGASKLTAIASFFPTPSDGKAQQLAHIEKVNGAHRISITAFWYPLIESQP
jgi:hypothetical protein